MKVEIYNADCLEQLEKIKENSIDSIVTDPPYELNFMGKGWDNAGVSFNKETWEKCLKVLKPGGYLLAFGGSRTYHRISVAIEDAGFEIRDTIMWLYGSGFPKSMDVEKALNKRDGVEFKSKPASGVGFMNTNDDGYHNTINQLEQVGESSERAKQWKGWGSCLKPSFEPIIVARKPFKGSLVDNIIEYGVGGINIDECRVETNGELIDNHNTKGIPFMRNKEDYKENSRTKLNIGRFPANTILTYDETDFDEVCGGFPYTKSQKRDSKYNKDTEYTNTYTPVKSDYRDDNTYNDSGSAARYFYCAKASKKDRDEGLDEFEQQKVNDGRKKDANNGFQRGATLRHNIHPTVKPTTLMQYLIRLVTPKNGIILDPFMGSGSTGKAVMFENKERQANYSFIGIEKEKEYCDIARARIEWAKNYKKDKTEDNQIHIDELGGLI